MKGQKIVKGGNKLNSEDNEFESGDVERIKALTPADQSNQQKVIKQYAPQPKEIHSYSLSATSQWQSEDGTNYKSEVYTHSGNKPALNYLYKMGETGKFELVIPDNMNDYEKNLMNEKENQ